MRRQSIGRQISKQEDFITIDHEKCTGCGTCVAVCGGSVFEITHVSKLFKMRLLKREKKSVAARIDQCLECWNCEVACPAEAIQVQVPSGGAGIRFTCG